MTMPTKPVVLLWLNETGPYREALAEAGLADRVELHAVPMNEMPSPELMSRCEAMLAWRAGPGLFPRMPKLRWIQSQTGGSSNGCRCRICLLASRSRARAARTACR